VGEAGESANAVMAKAMASNKIVDDKVTGHILFTRM
jgi:hypothetical protein